MTATRGEYFGILRSAALGGLIIALMATLRIVLGWQGFAPMNAALAFCLNYGIGFVLIHILGGTVATKQPAMTANAIAASIGEARGKHRDLDSLVELIARTVRSQLGAILGNVGVAIPVAILIGGLVYVLSGQHFISPEQAHILLGEVNPLSGAILFAAIAGVCLFLSGLISGYYDNLSAYGQIPQRLLQLRWPRKVFGEARMTRVAAYVESNLGALAGNFFFGFLLGGVTALGVLFGLPLDIRHIAFSSAYVGHALIGLDFGLTWQLAMLSLLGVLLIGIVNLTVSFTLTLSVAMRARRITFAQGQELLGLIFKRLLTAPRDFFLPPRRSSKKVSVTDTADLSDEPRKPEINR
jgi:site-specific recombinase